MTFALLGGSLRPESINRRFLNRLAARLVELGHPVVTFQGEDLRLPLYEDGLPVPEPVTRMAEALVQAQGLIIVSPEYNAGIPGHLKNAIDWLSTIQPSPWTLLPVLLTACSPGAFGGSRGLIAWRATLANMGALVVPQAVPIPLADQTPLEPRTQRQVSSVLEGFLEFAQRLTR